MMWDPKLVAYLTNQNLGTRHMVTWAQFCLEEHMLVLPFLTIENTVIYLVLWKCGQIITDFYTHL